MGRGYPDELWDGNGGRLDPRTASTRDLLVALHVKLDVVMEDVKDHEIRIREVEKHQISIAAVGRFQRLIILPLCILVFTAVIGILEATISGGKFFNI